MPSFITVTSNADSGTGSLREAIAITNAQLEHTIDFASSLSQPIITLTLMKFPW